MGTTNGYFSCQSLFAEILSHSSNPYPSIFFLKRKAPPKVLAFKWLAILGRILNMDNLQRQVDHHKCMSYVLWGS